MINELQYVRRLNLSTGIVDILSTTDDINMLDKLTLHIYFKSISDLNEYAHEYGYVYLPTDNALSLIGGQ